MAEKSIFFGFLFLINVIFTEGNTAPPSLTFLFPVTAVIAYINMSISTYLHTSKCSHKCLLGKELSETNLHLNRKKGCLWLGSQETALKTAVQEQVLESWGGSEGSGTGNGRHAAQGCISGEVCASACPQGSSRVLITPQFVSVKAGELNFGSPAQSIAGLGPLDWDVNVHFGLSRLGQGRPSSLWESSEEGHNCEMLEEVGNGHTAPVKGILLRTVSAPKVLLPRGSEQSLWNLTLSPTSLCYICSLPSPALVFLHFIMGTISSGEDVKI